jgi:hypothetical protein
LPECLSSWFSIIFDSTRVNKNGYIFSGD